MCGKRRTISRKSERTGGKRVPSVRSERVEARIRPEIKQNIEEAAHVLGVSVSQFITESAQMRAQEVIQRYHNTVLNKQDSQRFAEALLSAPELNQSLKKAARLYAQRIKK